MLLCVIDVTGYLHPFTDSRLLSGEFYTTFSSLRENPDKFFTYFRINIFYFLFFKYLFPN